MRADRTCRQIEVELSARLDQEVDPATSALIDEHLAGCASCRAHEEQLRAVKRAVALQAAPPVRDLAPSVTSRLTRDRYSRRGERRRLLRTGVAAAVITTIVLSGAMLPWRTRPPDVAIASEITRAIRAAATEVSSYHAEFKIVERGWNDAVPERHFAAEVWFRAPEELRMEIRDLTPYPAPGWPRNDATLIASPSRWWIEETATCPAPALPDCAVSPAPEVRSLERRQPFDGSTSLPTDLILPLETLAETDGLSVVGRETVDGHDVHHVVLERWQAGALIDSLQVAGTWNEFPPTARVDLWLDSSTWFPRRFTVKGDGGFLSVSTTLLEEPRRLDTSVFTAPAPQDARDGGFRSEGEGSRLLPEDLAGLEPYRSGVTRDRQTVDTFVDGMTWLKVITDRASRPTLGTFTSESVSLGPGRSAYFEPSSDSLRRTVEIIGSNRRVRLESNLPRAELLEVAASVPLDGRSFDELRTATGRIERIDPRSLGNFPFAEWPRYLPHGFRVSSAFLSTSPDGRRQLSSYYRRPESGAFMGDIRITQAADVDVLPPSSEDLVSVRTGPVAGRWSPLRSELEWLDGSVYRAVAVPGFDVETAALIARSMQR